VERRHDVGDERRGIELGARVMEGVRELKRERGKGAVRARGAPRLLYGREGGGGGRDRQGGCGKWRLSNGAVIGVTGGGGGGKGAE
jgi:hypothetical protein